MSELIRWFAKPLKWLAIGVFSLVAVIVLAGNGYRIYATARIEGELPPPGRMVSIGTHDMHIHCVGSGSPTVILDAGGMGFSAMWGGVMERAEDTTRLCAFDRSGMGWSESGPGEISVESRLADLEALLDASGEPAPYIFVGHSAGAVFAWLYAQDHRDEAAGVITVDGGTARMLDILEFGDVSFAPPPPAVILKRLGLFSVIGVLRSANPPPNLPPASAEAWTKSALLSEALFAELQYSPQVFESTRRIASLGDLPLIVIAHGRAGSLMSLWGEKRDEAEEMWQEMQRELAELSTDSTLLVAESSDHGIPAYQPEIIVRAIAELTGKYRAIH